MKRARALLYKLGYPLMRIYWFVRRPATTGVRCLLINGENVLLITHTYGNPLRTIPGGGVTAGETPEQAVVREVREEVGIELNTVTLVGDVKHFEEYKHDTIYVFVAHTAVETIIKDAAEIREASWHRLDALPADISPLFEKFLMLYYSQHARRT